MYSNYLITHFIIVVDLFNYYFGIIQNMQIYILYLKHFKLSNIYKTFS